MLRYTVLFFVLLFLATQSFSASFYQCKSLEGKTSFSDKPCPVKSTTTNTGKLISSTRIKKNGKIVAVLNPLLGEHKMIILAPKPAMGNTTLDWRCSSNFPAILLGGSETGLCNSREIY